MLVDSDDLISNRVAEYVNSHPDMHGFVSDYGYIYEEGTNYLQKILALWRTCGSCSIVNYSVSDLPESIPNGLYDDSLAKKYIIRMSHRTIPIYLKEHDRKLELCPFPTTIYVRNTGDNHSALNGGDMSWKRKMELLLRKKIRITDSIRAEYFGINN